MRKSQLERMLVDERRAHEREREAWLRERQDLLDRIMYLAERPWSPPPAEVRPIPSPEELQPEVAWPVVFPEDHTPEEMGDMQEMAEQLTAEEQLAELARNGRS